MKSFLSTLLLVAVALMSTPTTHAQVHVFHSDSSNVNINRLQLSNTPLANAIRLVAELGQVQIFVDRDTIDEAGTHLKDPVTATIKNATVKEILDQLLPTRLGYVSQGSAIIISTRKRIDSGKSFEVDSDSVGLMNIAQLAVDEAMSRSMPIHFDHMPLEMAVQMLAGMAGKHAEFEGNAASQRFTRISLHRDGATIRKNLDDLLAAVDMTWTVRGHALVIHADKN